MAMVNDGLIPSQYAADQAANATTAQVQLFIVASKAILTACNLSAFTCTCSVSGATTQDLQALLEQLHLGGYTTSISGTTLTINW